MYVDPYRVPCSSYPSTGVQLQSGDYEHRDEWDFEFLGSPNNSRGMTLQTNVFMNGQGDEEVLTAFAFDPAAAFHTYTIQWGPQRTVWLVDGVNIRTVSNSSPHYPKDPMKVYFSIWDASPWATGPRTARIPVNYDYATVSASFSAISRSRESRGGVAMRYLPGSRAQWRAPHPFRLPAALLLSCLLILSLPMLPRSNAEFGTKPAAEPGTSLGSVDPREVVETISDSLSDLAAAVNSGDACGILDFFPETSSILPPHSPELLLNVSALRLSLVQQLLALDIRLRFNVLEAWVGKGDPGRVSDAIRTLGTRGDPATGAATATAQQQQQRGEETEEEEEEEVAEEEEGAEGSAAGGEGAGVLRGGDLFAVARIAFTANCLGATRRSGQAEQGGERASGVEEVEEGREEASACESACVDGSILATWHRSAELARSGGKATSPESGDSERESLLECRARGARGARNDHSKVWRMHWAAWNHATRTCQNRRAPHSTAWGGAEGLVQAGSEGRVRRKGMRQLLVAPQATAWLTAGPADVSSEGGGGSSSAVQAQKGDARSPLNPASAVLGHEAATVQQEAQQGVGAGSSPEGLGGRSGGAAVEGGCAQWKVEAALAALTVALLNGNATAAAQIFAPQAVLFPPASLPLTLHTAAQAAAWLQPITGRRLIFQPQLEELLVLQAATWHALEGDTWLALGVDTWHGSRVGSSPYVVVTRGVYRLWELNGLSEGQGKFVLLWESSSEDHTTVGSLRRAMHGVKETELREGCEQWAEVKEKSVLQ
ncbi:unnamed protein product [Closterium sp. Naga37s-1]|nr:unnamed protein product [Closterium sp. Naga37s-1]